MLAISVASEREIKDYLMAGKFRPVERRDSIRFYLSPVVRDVVVVESGAGRGMCQEAANLVIDKYQPRLIVSAGYAAGARPGMSPGDVFVCQRLLGLTGEPAYWSADTVLQKSVPESVFPYDQWNDIDIQWGSCMAMPFLVAGSSMKEWLGQKFEIDLVDMESYWVSEVAEEHGIPVLNVRVVFDPMEQSLPSFVSKALVGSVAGVALRAALYGVSHPTSIKGIISLRTQSKRATESLSRFLSNLTQNCVQAVKLPAGAR